MALSVPSHESNSPISTVTDEASAGVIQPDTRRREPLHGVLSGDALSLEWRRRVNAEPKHDETRREAGLVVGLVETGGSVVPEPPHPNLRGVTACTTLSVGAAIWAEVASRHQAGKALAHELLRPPAPLSHRAEIAVGGLHHRVVVGFPEHLDTGGTDGAIAGTPGRNEVLRMRQRLAFWMLIPAIVVFTLALGACSDDEEDGAGDTVTAGTTTTEAHEEDGSDLADAEVSESLVVEMRDFEFAPASLEVATGNVVEIAFSNPGSVAHDFTIEEADLDSMMMGEMEMVEGHGGDEHTAGMAMHVALEMGHDATVRMRVHEPGEYTFYCTVVGHRELGMEGILHVN